MARNKSRAPLVSLSLMLLLALVMGVSGIAYVFSSNMQLNTQSHASTQPVYKNITINYMVKKGWNMYSFPFALPADIAAKIGKPINMMAYDILASNHVNNNSGYSEIIGLIGSQWAPSAMLDNVDQIGYSGKNFPLVPGYGYAFKSDVSGTIEVSGILDEAPIVEKLVAGYNLIGLPVVEPGTKASDIMYSLYQSGFNVKSAEVDELIDGTGDTPVYTKYTLQHPFQNDFVISNAVGYTISVYSSGSWSQNVLPTSWKVKSKMLANQTPTPSMMFTPTMPPPTPSVIYYRRPTCAPSRIYKNGTWLYTPCIY